MHTKTGTFWSNDKKLWYIFVSEKNGANKEGQSILHHEFVVADAFAKMLSNILRTVFFATWKTSL